MKAAFFYSPNLIKIEETKIPDIHENDLLVKVHAAAVCGTDLRIYKSGHFKIPQGSRRVLGHEIAGEVVDIGKNVTGYNKGIRVMLASNIGCGTCKMCIAGLNQLCPDYEAFGISYDGGFEEYVKVPQDAVSRGNVIKIPKNLSYEEAALVEPLSCTYNAFESLETSPGETVLIIGGGPIGACHAMLHRLAGAGKIIVADVSELRLKEIKKFGADIVINSSQQSLQDCVMEQTDNQGADIIITACSSPQMQTLSLELAAPCGKINFFGGISKEKEMVPLNTNLIHYKELKVVATTGSSIQDCHRSMTLVENRQINLKELVTARFSLDDIEKAFDYLASGKGMKAVISF